MIEPQRNVENALFDDFRMSRMVSMLQPLGKRRRLKKVKYLCLNSDFMTTQIIEDINNIEFITIDTNSVEYRQMIQTRSKKSNRVKQNVQKISKVFGYCEISSRISQNENVSISTSQYYLDVQNESKPLEVINNFFMQNSENEADGFVIYFSGVITKGVPCMGFQIKEKVYVITIHHIIKAWKRFLKGFKHKKQLLLIIESPQAAQFLDSIQKCKSHMHHYNISFLISDKEKRLNSEFDHSFQGQNTIPSNSNYRQDEVWKINDYAQCSGFTAALCEYLLNSPPERIKQLYQLKEKFYSNRYNVQPGFFGYSMKSYLDFGWFLDINYDKIYQQSCINYFGINQRDYSQSMEQISKQQDNIVYQGFDYTGFIKDETTKNLLSDPQLIEKEKKQGSLSSLLSLNSIDQDQLQFNLQHQNSDYFQSNTFPATNDQNKISRFLNGFQIYSNVVKYIGQWLNNKQHGVGIALYENGTRYEGEFVDGKQQGSGYLYNYQRQNIYAGQFYKDMFFGKGLVIWLTRDTRVGFLGNFNDKQGTGVLIELSEFGETLREKKGIISDREEFKNNFQDHEEILEIPEENESMFSSVKDPSWYEVFYKENRIDYKCSFKKQFEEHQKKKEKRKQKAEEVIKLLFFKNNQQNNEIPNSPISPQTQQNVNQPIVISDVAELPQYEELKKDLNELNPDLDNENIKADDVEFLVKHAVCKVEMKKEEIEEKNQKTEEIEQNLNSLFQDFDNIKLTAEQTPLSRTITTQVTSFSQADQEQNQAVNLNQNNNQQQQQPQLTNQHSEQNKKLSSLIPLIAMKQVYQQQGVKVFVSDQKIEQDVTQQYKQSQLQIGQTSNTSYMKLKIQDNEKINFDNSILSDQKEEFIKQLKENLAKAHGCEAKQIVIVALNKGSIEAEYKFKDENACTKNKMQAMEYLRNECNYKGANLEMQNLLDMATLTPEDIYQPFNSEWNVKKLAYRGFIKFHHNNQYQKFRYNLPVGWKGFGLNIFKYNDRDWLGNFGNRKDYDEKKQWIPLYHGTNIHAIKGIKKDGFKSGSHHKYAGATCRITGKIIDKSSNCVYLTDNADIAGSYSTPFEIGGQAFKMVFQCRVNPEKVKSPKDKPDYYIVEEDDKPQLNIRPYRILLKKLTEEEYNEFKKLQQEVQNNQTDGDKDQQLKDQIMYQAEEIGNRDQIEHQQCSSESDDSENKSNQDKSE
ncbi:MORN domain protein (macronuclear) [Tetrahymena thermophila SB210]|uniref:MORN domain protein n=1 Tax=Tetrahymena thermophila (strain SB210) TaxID=312017 RepID=Q23AI9_TETTS|nr:MORN domain protein [Tetrahymena thermophila SB210]EAR93503.1 MORN domain protein [Tetrahymena thermophila SB210]|eukprot:XP_001013748.1 MORN domain protein [Tetrahymena thermophila SB210]